MAGFEVIIEDHRWPSQEPPPDVQAICALHDGKTLLSPPSQPLGKAPLQNRYKAEFLIDGKLKPPILPILGR
jgi:hypothetical protein